MSARSLGRYVSPVICLGAVLLLSVPALGAPPDVTYEQAGKVTLINEELVELCKPSICMFESGIALEGDEEHISTVFGSGVLIHPSGILLTNVHVAAECTTGVVSVFDWEQRPIDVEGVLAYDIASDWVALKVHYSSGRRLFPYAKLGDSRNLKEGQACMAIGNPRGLTLTPTFGTIQKPSRRIPSIGKTRIQHGAVIAGGSSGGGLFDLKGGLVGINTEMLTATGLFGESLDLTSNIGLAIPLHEIMLPVDTSRLIPIDCFCTYLEARDNVLTNSDFEGQREVIVSDVIPECSEFSDAFTLLAICNYGTADYSGCVEQCRNALMLDSANATAVYYLGMGWIRSGHIDSARAVYPVLQPLDASLAAELTKAIAIAGLSPTREDTTSFIVDTAETGATEAVETDTLSATTRMIFEHFGSDGVRIYDLIDGDRTAEQIMNETGVTETFLVDVLEFMADSGIIILERPEPDTTSYEPWSWEEPTVDTGAIADFIRDRYMQLFNQGDSWEQAAILAQEVLTWGNDTSDYEMDYANLGLALHMLGEYQVADQVLTEGIVLCNPQTPFIFSNRGSDRIQLQDYAGAEADFRQALEYLATTSTDDYVFDSLHCRVGIFAGLAYALWQQGKSAEARQFYAELTALEPGWKDGPVEYPDYYYTEDDRAVNLDLFLQLSGQ